MCTFYYKLCVAVVLCVVFSTNCADGQFNFLSQFGFVSQFFRNGLLGTILGRNPRMSPIANDLPEPFLNGDSKTEYDFIIVGSGPAGSVLANRLSEIREWNILLLEAGIEENGMQQMPVVCPLFQLSEYDWQYKMEKQPNFALGMKDQTLLWPRGKALGGSSVINYMIYTRGSPIDYDRWAAQGNPGWSYADILPYYLKSEKMRHSHFVNPNYHNTSGLWGVENSYRSPMLTNFINAGKSLGYSEVDYSSDDIIGFAGMQANLNYGRRHSCANAFLRPVRHRSNLRIVTGATVAQVYVDDRTNEATGVKFFLNGRTYEVFARKEIILSAGALASPQLLMLSGIGPEEQLVKLDIDVKADLPVGKNLHDHLTFVGLTFLTNELYQDIYSKLLNPGVYMDWMLYGTGPVTSLGGVEGIAYIQTNKSTETRGYPDIELLFVGGSIAGDFGLMTKRTMNIRDDVYNDYFAPMHGTPSFQIYPMLLHPRSTGRLELASTDPFDKPRFYGNYLTDENGHDIDTLVAGVRFVQHLVRAPSFKKYNVRMHGKTMPGCTRHKYDSDDYWRCAIRTMTITLHHQVGTCRMGPEGDAGAVVDPRLRVHGIKRLRVADTSIIPFALSAHTNAPSVMVGEKAADMIKEDYGFLRRPNATSEESEKNLV